MTMAPSAMWFSQFLIVARQMLRAIRVRLSRSLPGGPFQVRRFNLVIFLRVVLQLLLDQLLDGVFA
jgi:hypothetical protein